MVLPRKFRDVLLALALLAVPVLFLQANLKSPSELTPIDQVILRVSAPIQNAVTTMLAGVHTGWRRYVYLVGVEKENERLVRENLRLRAAVKAARRDLARLRYYERLLGFRQAQGVETVGVRVIGRGASPFVRSLRLRVDRGKSVLKPGLSVVTADGVVGRIGRVYGRYADVVLAVDPRSAIDVVVKRTGARGLLRGIDGTNRYVCRIEYLLRDAEVKVGDLVVTSGAGGVFPKDLPVGRISRVTKRTYGLYQEVEVTPSVDYGSLKEMLVILSPRPPPAPKADGRLEPARGILP